MEVVIDKPIPLIWMGEEPDGPWEVGQAFWWYTSDRMSPLWKPEERRPIGVVCPAWLNNEGELVGTVFGIDQVSTVKGEPWNVTVDLSSLVIGQKPNITVSPSIHLVGIWHGWLEEGMLHQ